MMNTYFKLHYLRLPLQTFIIIIHIITKNSKISKKITRITFRCSTVKKRHRI